MYLTCYSFSSFIKWKLSLLVFRSFFVMYTFNAANVPYSVGAESRHSMTSIILNLFQGTETNLFGLLVEFPSDLWKKMYPAVVG